MSRLGQPRSPEPKNITRAFSTVPAHPSGHDRAAAFSMAASIPSPDASDGFDGIGELVRQSPAIGHLDRDPCSHPGALPIGSGAVTTDDPRAAMARR